MKKLKNYICCNKKLLSIKIFEGTMGVINGSQTNGGCDKNEKLRMQKLKWFLKL